MGRLLSKVERRFTKVPERNPALGVLALVMGLGTMALQFFRSVNDIHVLLHLAIGLGILLEAAPYSLPDDQRRHKIALRIAQLLWLASMVIPLLWMGFWTLSFHTR